MSQMRQGFIVSVVCFPPKYSSVNNCPVVSCYLWRLYSVNLFCFSGFFHVFHSEAETGNRGHLHMPLFSGMKNFDTRLNPQIVGNMLTF